MAFYGIDLGTTNSLIGLHDAGYLSDIVPSCTNLATGETGSSMFDNMDATRSFKVDMSMGKEGYTPRIASANVLKELIKQVKNDTVKDVVISVPAYFNDNQRSATMASAKAAGLEVKALVNEPTAAAMYIANQKQGLYVVYDLGGGTFDCSIIDSRFGTFDVQATDGRKIGGDNFDANIMRFFIKEGRIPIHKLTPKSRMALQHFASKRKIKMQKKQATFEIDLTEWNGTTIKFTPEKYRSIMELTFSETINCLKKLLRAWIPSTEVYSILLVGGSTHCPFLQKWIEVETGQKPAELTYDPDRVVAQGAALYASLLEKGNVSVAVSDVTKQLGIGLYDGTIDVLVPANSKIPLSTEKLLTNKVKASGLELDLYQGTSIFTKDSECIGKLLYNYDGVREAMEGNVIITIKVDMSGVITLSAKELLGKEQSITLRRYDKV